MSFFTKQSSKDFLFKKSSELRSSLTEGSSRLLGSVIDTKASLVDGISSKFDKVVKLTSGSEPAEASETGEGAARTPEPGSTTAALAVSSPTAGHQNGAAATVTGSVSHSTAAADCIVDAYVRDSYKDSGRRRTNPFLNEDLADVNPFAEDVTVATGETGNSTSTNSSYYNPFRSADNSAHTAMSYYGAGTGTGDGSRLTAARPVDPFAITPTSEQALPKPALEPKRVQRASTGGDESDGDSESTEGCDENPEDPGDDDFDGGSQDVGGRMADLGLAEARRLDDGKSGLASSGSRFSDLSWSSSINEDAPMDDLSRQSMEFMRGFVAKVFDNRSFITQDDKATYGQLIRCSVGRLWFARYVNAQANHRVDEQNFFRLVQFLAVALFECNEEEDFGPARKLMNMCFVFYLEVEQPNGPTYKHFLYSYLKDQPIWRSLRFWNAAFFDSVQAERAQRQPSASQDAVQKIREEHDSEEKIVFNQLETFTSNMRSLGLDKNLCLDFLRKQSGIVSLRDEHLQMLKEHIENWQG